MRPLSACGASLLSVVALKFAVGCSSNSAAPSAEASVDAGAADGGGSSKIAAQSFEEFAPWASPIDDYLAVGRKHQPGKFNASINELMAAGDRLFFGYGDADYNLGEKIPIEMRAFRSPDDPASVEGVVVLGDGQGAPQKTPRQSGEEQIDRYRMLDGELWQAGIDSTDPDELWTQENTTPKGIQGNVYRLEGETFKKHRTVNGGEHVHDLASYKGAIYSVGSGADFRTEFEAGQVFRYLWRSNDRGQSFQTVTRVQVTTPGEGDTRFIHLLPTSGPLFAFGYESVYSSGRLIVKNISFDGTAVTELGAGHPLQKILPRGTLPLPDGTGVLWGTVAGRETFARVAPDGALTPVTALSGLAVVDVSLTGTSEVLVLTAASVPGAKPAAWNVRLFVADLASLEAATELVQLTLDVAPTAIAHFKNALFLGVGDGRIFKAGRR